MNLASFRSLRREKTLSKAVGINEDLFAVSSQWFSNKNRRMKKKLVQDCFSRNEANDKKHHKICLLLLSLSRLKSDAEDYRNRSVFQLTAKMKSSFLFWLHENDCRLQSFLRCFSHVWRCRLVHRSSLNYSKHQLQSADAVCSRLFERFVH